MIGNLMFLSLSEKDDEYNFEIVQKYIFDAKGPYIKSFHIYLHILLIYLYQYTGFCFLQKSLICTFMNLFLLYRVPHFLKKVRVYCCIISCQYTVFFIPSFPIIPAD